MFRVNVGAAAGVALALIAGCGGQIDGPLGMGDAAAGTKGGYEGGLDGSRFCYCACTVGPYAGQMGYRPQCTNGCGDASYDKCLDPCVPLGLCSVRDGGAPDCQVLVNCAP